MAKFFLIILFVCSAFGLTEVDRQDIVHKNILSPYNSGFENGISNWTASGGALASVISGTNLLIGKGSATWNSSAASQTWRSKLVTIPKGLYGTSGMIRCKSQTPSGTATHKFQVFDGTNVIGEQNLVSSTSPLNQTVNFIFPSSGSLQIQFTSVAADEPLIAVDDCYIGSATNLSEVSQAEFYGSQEIVGQTNCRFTGVTTNAWTNYASDSDCATPIISGYANTTAGKIPGISFASLPPGRYRVTAIVTQDETVGATACSYRVSDGTNGGGNAEGASNSLLPHTIEYDFIYTTAQGPKIFQVQGRNPNATNDCHVTNERASMSVYLSVYRFPTSSQTVYTPDTFSSSWAGYHAYSASCLWSRTNTAFGDFTGDADCNLVETINQNFGNVTSYGGATEQPGLVFTPIRSGLYEICAEGQFYNSASAFSALRLTADGSTQIAAQALDMVTGTYTPFKLCGFHRVSSTAQVSIRLEGRSSSGTLNIGGSSSAGQNVVEWTIKQIEQAIPVPIFVGGVTASSPGAERIARFSFNWVAGTPTELTDIGGVASGYVDNTTGDTTVTIAAGTFSASPFCFCNVKNNTATMDDTQNRNCRILVISSTSMRILVSNAASTAVDEDDAVEVMCIGVK